MVISTVCVTIMVVSMMAFGAFAIWLIMRD